MPESTTVTLTDVDAFKLKALTWANYFNVVCLLDSNLYTPRKYSSFEWVLAVDSLADFTDSEQINQYLIGNDKSNLFGFISYDYKNELENLISKNRDNIGFADFYFFKPRYILEIKQDKITVNRNYPETFELIELIEKIKLSSEVTKQPIELKARTNRNTYLNNIERIREQIAAGDFYELNYCNEFFAENASINPVATFQDLNAIAAAPFSCFFKWHNKYLLCASPERFLRKEKKQLVSEPIKGTIRKGNSIDENELLKTQLSNSEKDRAENIMIVDLVRNDLAKSSVPGSVIVEELCSVYEFKSVFQLISRITAQANDDIEVVDIIKKAFPMGSMTGAPKIDVMKNIDRYESFKRGLYSGCVGYLTAEGDFDFNVVIRSIFYNSETDYLSIRAGGAITYDSIAEQEWDEILLKLKLLLNTLRATIATD